MNIQNSVIVLFGVYSLFGFLLGIKNTHFKKNPYGLTPYFSFLGAFVWVDAVTFGAFFLVSSIVSIILQNFILLLLIYSIFWIVRSIGESVYWLLEQFAEKHKNKPENLKGHKFFPGDSIYIHYQIFWQCICVISITFSVYFFYLFLVY